MGAKRLYPVGQHCAAEGCERAVASKGHCHAHRKQFVKWGYTRPLKPKRIHAVGQRCADAGCERKAVVKGYCQGHHRQFKESGRTKPLVKRRPVVGERILCSRCRQFRPTAEFAKRKTGSTNAFCRSCTKDYNTDRNYGAGAAQWKRERLAAQGGRCHLCNTTDGDSSGWCLDHDHETMKWRSVICKPCNTVLGYVERGWNAWVFVKTLRTSDGYGHRLETVRSTHAQ